MLSSAGLIKLTSYSKYVIGMTQVMMTDVSPRDKVTQGALASILINTIATVFYLLHLCLLQEESLQKEKKEVWQNLEAQSRDLSQSVR